MDYFSRKSLSKYLITIEFNKHDVDIFINGTFHKATTSPSNVSRAYHEKGDAIRHCATGNVDRSYF
jgi:hypothetical protein